ncbi:MAG: 50S ribosomal protein L25 [Candidatus Poribacteria bacterium]|nr:50S ribosomal protein L25 [Candidatus Poribacteria bacterium]
MQQARLDAQVRDDVGKGVARSLRRAGKVPAVLYGRKRGAVSLQIDDRTFQTLLRNYGSNVLINLVLGNDDEQTVVIKDLQRHPVKRNVLHADFQRISLDEKITTQVSIETVGTPVGVRDGGVLTVTRRQVSVNCLPLDTPEFLRINVEDLSIGDSFRVSDIEIDDTIEILENEITQIAAVIEPKVVLETITAEEEEIEGEEGLEDEEAADETEGTEEVSE